MTEVRRYRRRGFTLIELLVVIAIIGLLAAMVMGLLPRANVLKVRGRVRAEPDLLLQVPGVPRRRPVGRALGRGDRGPSLRTARGQARLRRGAPARELPGRIAEDRDAPRGPGIRVPVRSRAHAPRRHEGAPPDPPLRSVAPGRDAPAASGHRPVLRVAGRAPAADRVHAPAQPAAGRRTVGIFRKTLPAAADPRPARPRRPRPRAAPARRLRARRLPSSSFRLAVRAPVDRLAGAHRTSCPSTLCSRRLSPGFSWPGPTAPAHRAVPGSGRRDGRLCSRDSSPASSSSSCRPSRRWRPTARRARNACCARSWPSPVRTTTCST